MKLLLDTHIFVWTIANPSRLSRRAAKVIGDARNELWISPVTTWEILFLHRKGRLNLKDALPNTFGPQIWGITASDSRTGYRAWGAAAAQLDGTLVPCAAGGSIAFLPDECGRVLKTMMDRYGKNVWTRYGFVDAFQPDAKWWSPDVIGIDLGIMLIMAENSRRASVWDAMMTTPEVVRAMDAVGLKKI